MEALIDSDDRNIGLEEPPDLVSGRDTGRINGLGQKLSRQFLWLVGVQVTVLLAVIGALLRG